MSIPDLLHAALAEDTSRPLITFYDESTGERVELSVATVANWVSKTANMLQDSLGADETTTVRQRLPVHWESCTWLLACWSVGCVVTFEHDADVDLAVVGPRGWEGEDADDIVALSLRPLGARFAEPLPAGIVDYNAEVLGHGDHFTPHLPPGDETPALRRTDGEVSHARLVHETSNRVDDHARMLLVGDHDQDEQAMALLTTLGAAGSLVLVRDPSGSGLTEERRAAIAADERVSVGLT